MDGYLSINELADKWGLTPRRIQKMCSDGVIPGAVKFCNVWVVPDTVERPSDRRIKTGKYRNSKNIKKK